MVKLSSLLIILVQYILKIIKILFYVVFIQIEICIFNIVSEKHVLFGEGSSHTIAL